MTEGKQIYYHRIRVHIKNTTLKFKELAVKSGAYEDGDSIITGPMDETIFARNLIEESLVFLNGHGVSVTEEMKNKLLNYFGVAEFGGSYRNAP